MWVTRIYLTRCRLFRTRFSVNVPTKLDIINVSVDHTVSTEWTLAVGHAVWPMDALSHYWNAATYWSAFNTMSGTIKTSVTLKTQRSVTISDAQYTDIKTTAVSPNWTQLNRIINSYQWWKTRIISWPASFNYLIPQCLRCYNHLWSHWSKTWRLKRVSRLFITRKFTQNTQ